MRLMVRLGTLLIRRLAPAVVCALALVACGSAQKPSVTTSTTTTAATTTTVVNGTTTTLTRPTLTDVSIYSSLPESGPDAGRSHQIETGIRLALNQADDDAGAFHVRYTQQTQLCDSAPERRKSHAPSTRSKVDTAAKTSRRCTGGWNQTATAGNAEKAAGDPQTVAYIGDLNSGATAISLPILNQAGIVQITPGSGYPGLTDSVPVKSPKGIQITSAGEPGKYYPEGLDHRTLLRMIPNDLVQASAELYVLHKSGCEKFSAWNFSTDPESKSLLAAVTATALKYKMSDYPSPLPKQTKEYEPYAQTLAQAGVRCAIMIGHVTHDAIALTTFLGNHLPPTATIVGSTGFCSASWARGMSKNIASRLYCTTPALPVTQYTGSAGFIKDFRKAYKREPTAYNVYGYVATEMVLQALSEIETGQDVRRQVLSNMVDDTAPNTFNIVRGHISGFSFLTDGNLAADDQYGVDGFKSGRPQHSGTVDVPPRYLLSSAG
jgi:branched-chain amino acid transport system substrate-binding protein